MAVLNCTVPVTPYNDNDNDDDKFPVEGIDRFGGSNEDD